MTKEKTSLSDWIQYFNNFLIEGTTMVFGILSLVLLISLSIYFFARWGQILIFIPVTIALIIVLWMVYGKNSPYKKGRIILRDIMCGKKDDPVQIQKEWCKGVENMEENKNRFNCWLWIIVGIIVGILIGLVMCVLLSSGILSDISIDIFLPQFLGSFSALLIALFVFWLGQCFSKKNEEKRQLDMKENFISLLKSEINFNVNKADQIKKEAKKNLLPNYRFKIDIKNACWARIVEYWHKDRELINEISLLYFKYELLNRTIDTGLQRINSKLPIIGLFDEVGRICKKIEEKSKEVLKKF